MRHCSQGLALAEDSCSAYAKKVRSTVPRGSAMDLPKGDFACSNPEESLKPEPTVVNGATWKSRRTKVLVRWHSFGKAEDEDAATVDSKCPSPNSDVVRILVDTTMSGCSHLNCGAFFEAREKLEKHLFEVHDTPAPGNDRAAPSSSTDQTASAVLLPPSSSESSRNWYEENGTSGEFVISCIELGCDEMFTGKRDQKIHELEVHKKQKAFPFPFPAVRVCSCPRKGFGCIMKACTWRIAP